MANQVPFAGTSDAAGGILLPTAQGQLLTNGLLKESGALSLAGDSRTTTSRREQFPIWLGAPTAGFVGEGGTKLVTGGEFAGGTMNIKKVATIVMFTDEMIEDVQGGDLNVLVDGGVREAISSVIDAHVIGKTNGADLTTNFDTALRSSTSVVEYNASNQEGLRLAVSAAMGSLEANGYNNQAALIPGDAPRLLRDARQVDGGGTTNTPLYDVTRDPLYGLQTAVSTNLNPLAGTAGTGIVKGFVVSKPNLHVRIRKGVTVTSSKEASVHDGTSVRSLFQENLTAVRYETRLGFYVHDLNRAVVKIVDVS